MLLHKHHVYDPIENNLNLKKYKIIMEKIIWNVQGPFLRDPAYQFVSIIRIVSL